jgi:IS30 family transposase
LSDDLPVTSDDVRYAHLALYIHDRDVRLFDAEPKRTELVLADAGWSLTAIAALTGRNYETIKTAVRRARASAAKKDPAAKKTSKRKGSQA